MENRKFRFNFVDIIIVLLVVAVFCFGYMFICKNSSTLNDAPKVSFTVEVKKVMPEYKDNFKIGDDVMEAIKGGYLGKITAVKSTPATDLVSDQLNGEYVISNIDDREDVYVTIEGRPSSIGSEIIISGQKVRIGEMAYFKNFICAGRGYIVDMKIEEGNSND